MDRALVIVIRTRETVDIGEPGEPFLVDVPAIDAGWTRKPQPQPASDTPWVDLIDDEGRRFWWYTVDTAIGGPGRIVGRCAPIDPADNAALVTFARSSESAWTLPQLRGDGGGLETAVLAAWREHATDDDPEPTGTPIVRQTMAGHDWRSAAERYASVNDIPE